MAARCAAFRSRRADRLDRYLRRARRTDLSAQPAVDRRYTGHELRLAGPGNPASANARREGTGLASRIDELQAAVGPLPDHRCNRHRYHRPYWPDADILW